MALRLAAPEPSAAGGRSVLRHRLTVAAPGPPRRARGGMEIQAEAIEAARENAQLNGLADIDFHAADVRPLLKWPPHPVLDAARPDEADRPAVVLVDPPRAGMARKALQRAAALGAERLVVRVLQPHHAGRQRRRAGRAGLRPHARRARGHVPADAPHGDGGALRAPRLSARPLPRRAASGRRLWPPAAAPAPEQVRVHAQEGDRQQRQGRQRLRPQGRHDGHEERGRDGTPARRAGAGRNAPRRPGTGQRRSGRSRPGRCRPGAACSPTRSWPR